MSRKRNAHYEDIIEQGQDLIKFYLENPCIAAYDLLGVDLAPIQRLIFNDMWFKDYVIAVCGRGVGKSQYEKSLGIFKDIGLVHLDEVLPKIPSYLKDGEDEVIAYTGEVYTSIGFRSIKRLALEKNIEGKKLTTQNNFTNMGSKHHPVLTMDKACNFIYKPLESFVPGDRVCIQRGQHTFGNNNIPEDDAYLIGLFIGDGSLGKNATPNITTGDDEIKAFCIDYCIKNDIKYREDRDIRTKNTSKVYFKQFDYFFEQYGVARELSYTKSVPYSIRTADKETQIAFLKGYFDADGTADITHRSISCCSVSDKLILEIQLMLLNLDIVSRVRKKKTKSKFGKAYLLDIFSENAIKFKESIGFRLERKQKVIEGYSTDRKINTNRDTIPYALDICKSISNYYYSKYKTRKKLSLSVKTTNKKELTYLGLSKFLNRCKQINTTLFSLVEVEQEINKLEEILKSRYFFDRVVALEDWKGNCYDFEMDMPNDIEPNYFSNGFINHNTFLSGTLAALSAMLRPGYRVGLISPSFRQSKMIFAEIEKLYARSSILREACEKQPIRGTDSCYLKFKSVAGMNPSYIEAVPLGNDGGKIRGSRFYLILIDELAQVPDSILDLVIRPMSATSASPMERVRRMEEQQKLIKLGLATTDDFEKETVNKMIMTSSGYYKFNHMWRRMHDHWSQIHQAAKDGVDCPYAVWQVPYWDMPEGFLDMNNINEAKRVMSDSEFRMEYEAAMISDSEGFFKASMLEQCSLNTGHVIDFFGDKLSQYILGIDPNQGGKASTGIVVVKLGPVNRIVNVFELKNKTTQELTGAIQELCDKFNIVRIFMDKGGGGKAICDLLEEGYGSYEPIIDRTNDDHSNLQGRHILELVNFNPSWISDANFTTKAMLENRELLFPEPPVSSVSDSDSIIYESIKTLKSQMLNIVVTQTSTGLLHFDTPSKSQNKDLYSALILAAQGARILAKEMEEPAEPLLHNSGGMIRYRDGRTSFNSMDDLGHSARSTNPLAAAVLKKRPK